MFTFNWLRVRLLAARHSRLQTDGDSLTDVNRVCLSSVSVAQKAPLLLGTQQTSSNASAQVAK